MFADVGGGRDRPGAGHATTDGATVAVPRTFTVPLPSIPRQRTQRMWFAALGRLLGRHAPRRGVAVVGHGTADPVGAEETLAVARLVAGMLPGTPVEAGFLEVIGPSIGDALLRLADRGCTEVVAAPLLLFTAGHARRDVPEAVRDGAARAGLLVRQSAALGCHPAVVALSRARRGEALASLPPVPPEHTAFVMVGRGASDPSAPAQLAEFAAASAAEAGGEQPAFGRLLLGFVAAARPTLTEAIAAAAAAEAGQVRRAIVQPHLLFRGHVEEQVTAAVEEARRRHPEIEWVQVGRLGADPLVARAVVDRAAAAIAAEFQ
jgi:sirohydrochlorin cobaltochelatase